MGKLLNRKQILEADDRKVREIDVPEWGGAVRVMEMNALGRATLEMLTVKMEKGEIKHDNSKQRAILIAMSVVDENNQPVFTVEDVDALNKKSASAVKRVADVAMELAFPSTIEDAAKN